MANGSTMMTPFALRRPLLAVSLVAVLLGTLLLPLNSAGADPRMRYQGLLWSKSGYDYGPSILRDGSTWVMYHCGLNSSTNSDGIFRSTSADGVIWSAPTPVLTKGSPGQWDAGHVCDPSVLRTNIAGYSWAMWYTGAPTIDGGDDSIGLALSNDGINWVKSGSNPVIYCPTGSSLIYGCGQQSVAKVGSTYYMTHTECFANPCRDTRLRTSTDGLTWTASNLFQLPYGQVGPDIAYDDASGLWHLGIGGDIRCGQASGEAASQEVILTSYYLDMSWGQAGCLNYNEVSGAGRYMTEQGFFRDGDGHLPNGAADRWMAFGIGNNTFHDGSEEIRASKLAIMDAEQNSVDTYWGGAACSGAGPTMSSVQYAWGSDGPVGDDINYWDVNADADGVNEFCDLRLQNFVSSDFNAGTRLQITWHGWTTNGSNPSFDVYFKSNGVYSGPYTLSAPGYTKTVNTITLPALRTQAQEILFRVYENRFTNLWTANQTMRLHVYSVKLIN